MRAVFGQVNNIEVFFHPFRRLVKERPRRMRRGIIHQDYRRTNDMLSKTVQCLDDKAAVYPAFGNKMIKHVVLVADTQYIEPFVPPCRYLHGLPFGLPTVRHARRLTKAALVQVSNQPKLMLYF